jgi:hypothetical protein
LVRDNVIYVGDAEAVRIQGLDNRLRQDPHREFVDFAPVHRDLVQVFCEHLLGLRMQAAATPDRQDVGQCAVGMKMRRQETASLVRCRSEHEGSCRITEQDASVAVGPIDEAAQELGADDEHALGRPGADELVGDAHTVQ